MIVYVAGPIDFTIPSQQDEGLTVKTVSAGIIQAARATDTPLVVFNPSQAWTAAGPVPDSAVCRALIETNNRICLAADRAIFILPRNVITYGTVVEMWLRTRDEGRRKRSLIVSDDPSIRSSLIVRGLEVKIEPGIPEAVEWLTGYDPD